MFTNLKQCVISSFRRKVDENTLCWDITQPVVIISYRRFGTTYRSHLQGSRIQKDPFGVFTPEDGTKDPKGSFWSLHP